jgi:hypothetical protein
MAIDKILNEFIEICIFEFKKKKTRKRIEDDIVSPIIEFILAKLKPYILITSVFLTTIMLLMICLIYLIASSRT